MNQVDFNAWKDDPVTQTFFRWLAKKREETKESWARGQLTGPSWDETMIKNVAAIGACNAIDEILEIEFDQLEIEDD